MSSALDKVDIYNRQWRRNPRLLLRRALPASTRTSGFDSGFLLPRCFVTRRPLRASIQFWGNFGLQSSKFSTASVFAIAESGSDACFGLPCTLRRLPAVLAEWRRHRGRAPELAAGGRLNWAADGQPPAAALLGQRSAFNEPYFTFVCRM